MHQGHTVGLGCQAVWLQGTVCTVTPQNHCPGNKFQPACLPACLVVDPPRRCLRGQVAAGLPERLQGTGSSFQPYSVGPFAPTEQQAEGEAGRLKDSSEAGGGRH